MCATWSNRCTHRASVMMHSDRNTSGDSFVRYSASWDVKHPSCRERPLGVPKSVSQGCGVPSDRGAKRSHAFRRDHLPNTSPRLTRGAVKNKVLRVVLLVEILIEIVVVALWGDELPRLAPTGRQIGHDSPRQWGYSRT